MKLMVVMVLLLFASCSAYNEQLIPPQKWNNIRVVVESRPSPVRTGMNEFLIIASGDKSRPVHDLVVMVTTDESGGWKQAIQDGHVGVYRRALHIKDPAKALLYVDLKRGDENHKMQFVLSPRSAIE